VNARFCMREIGGNEVFERRAAGVGHGSLFIRPVDGVVAFGARFVPDELVAA
jgi:hypothetical protein